MSSRRGRGDYGGGQSPRKQGGQGYGSRGGGGHRGSRGGHGQGSGSVVPFRDLSRFEPTFDDDLEEYDGEIEINGNSQFVKRPGYLQDYERKIQLVSNHLRVRLSETVSLVYHYDVDITGIVTPGARGDREKKLNRKQKRTVINTLIASQSRPGGLFWSPIDGQIKPVFDGGKNLYTMKPLNGIGTNPGSKVSKKVRIDNDECIEKFSNHIVTIKLASDENGSSDEEGIISLPAINDYYDGSLDEFPMKAIAALNTIFRYGSLKKRFEVGANSMYHINCDRYYLGKGIEFAFGHFQSIRPVADGLSIIVDRTATAFAQNIGAKQFIEKQIQYGNNPVTMDDWVNLMNPRNSRMRKELYDELKKLHFYTLHTKKKMVYKRFKELSALPANKISFQSPTGKTTVAEYFKKQYGINLAFPQLPCMDFGNDQKNTYIPVELCSLVENQNIKGLLKKELSSQMIRSTAIPPKQRFLEIQEAVHNVKNESDEYLTEFELDMDITPIRCWGKIIKPPVLVYGERKTWKPSDGKWNMAGTKVFKPVAIRTWAAFQFYGNRAPGDHELANLVSSLRGMAQEMGIQIDAPKLTETLKFGDGVQRIKQILQKRPEFILFVQPKNDDFRAKIKQLCEVESSFGTLSQCIMENTARKATTDKQTMANILLKINTKCGGVNHILKTKPAALSRPGGVVVFGADVTHSAPADVLEKSLTASTGGERFEASVAAVVGTIDDEFFKYCTEVVVQRKERQEMITQLGPMVINQLRNYYANNEETLPETIVFYRDGVSEGQFKSVLDSEVTQMEKAFELLGEEFGVDYKPKLTFIIVQKRHHTRFRPRYERDGIGRMKNAPAGVVIDTKVTHPRDYDWYLNSHEGIQGTSRPTHYYVLRDDNDFSPKEMTEMTYHLCHTYAKATRSVSIPSPVYYAHWAAFRARDHIISATETGAVPHPKPPQNETSQQRDQRFARCVNELNKRVQVAERLKKFMYYL